MGAYELTWITLAIAAAPAVLAQPPACGGARPLALSLAVLALAGLYGFGAWRLGHAAKPVAGAPTIRVVQANIDQKDKWKPENLAMIFDTLYRPYHRPAAGARPSIVIWPEGALPAVIDELIAHGSPYRRTPLRRPGARTRP